MLKFEIWLELRLLKIGCLQLELIHQRLQETTNTYPCEQLIYDLEDYPIVKTSCRTQCRNMASILQGLHEAILAGGVGSTMQVN